ncbi:hypothetical protein SOVF_118230 [Spinacia oleracea]|uniref:F-box/kelch-repeat protein At3g06240-like n=1 Tax=Spinacia oleracea TaxID=3562 RepID=A0A9R0J766_SPIOL|nr:F-box/kelch-repeat protein At3g06240-like [Spinacia oleracea]KNA13203.1 hypothetical protein SOVF_118230 [Spinacia oleracea]
MFPEEIVVDILLRLPAKSIGRFRCVSKPWKSLLSEPQFIKAHLNRIKQHPTTEESIICRHFYALYSTRLNNAHHLFDEIKGFATKLNLDGHCFDLFDFQFASCDGLILVRDVEIKLLLINPTTREVKPLPEIDPLLSPVIFGIGYDSVNDDYKVVIAGISDEGLIFFIYSVKNGSWKRVEKNVPFDHNASFFSTGVFVNGYIHWVAYKKDVSIIAAFNVAEEKFCELPLPSIADIKKYSIDDYDPEKGELVFHILVELGGCLSGFPYRIPTNVWMMKEYGVQESWTFIPINDSDSGFRPLSLLGKEQMVMLMNDEKLVMYNLEKGTFKDITVQGIPSDFSVGMSFIETLVSPHCNNEAM